MKLTRRQAITLCRELWDWLSKHPSRDKYEWPGWKKHGKVLNLCFSCEYGSEESDYVGIAKIPVCKKCFLKKLWGNHEFACERSLESPYLIWNEAKLSGGLKARFNRGSRIDAAKEIVAECDRLLARYKK